CWHPATARRPARLYQKFLRYCPPMLLTWTSSNLPWALTKKKLPRHGQRECHLRVQMVNQGLASAICPRLSRWRLFVPKHHNRGPDKVYNRNIIKNIICGSAIISVIKIKPETNIQKGCFFRKSEFFKLKYGKPLTIKPANP